MEEDFISQMTSIIEGNLDDEQFGVSELASVMNMSRSNLLRKVKKHTGLSVSQFIRQVRLEIAMDLLKEGAYTISEVSFKVGFGSSSYFIKCFREHYGYPPGEVGNERTEVKESGTMPRKRLLVAIMFTDIAGYTSLMQKDEEKGIVYRERHREVFNSITKKYHGRILQYYGDGTLSTFPSAIDAVQCGIEMQLAFKEEPKVPIRIGIHSGDTIITDEEIIGDGVNVAARIEAMAKPGSVYISDKVYDEVKNQPGLITAPLGVHKLKNITKPMEVYIVSNHELGGIEIPDKNKVIANPLLKWSLVATFLILLGFIGYYSGILSEISRPESNSVMIEKSIAVLPFKNESSDSGNEYFINGLMESTLNNLQKIEDLRVVSRTSVEKYRNADMAIPEIAEELNVNYFVEGSGQKVGDQVLLHVQLIEASSDKHIWAEQYNRELADVFVLQNEVATKIAEAIEAIVTPEELEQIEKKPTENLIAYDYYLQALEPFHARTSEGLEIAIPLFKKAIEHDPEFALAYAFISISYYHLEIYQIEKQYTEQINYYADQALLYDPRSDVSLIAKAFYYMQIQDYRLAVPHLEKALEYNPNSSGAVQMLSDLYSRYIPNTAKYLEYALKGVQLDIAPNDSVQKSYLYLHLGNALIQNGFADESVKYINKSLDYNPNNEFSSYLRALILYAVDGNIERTKKMLIKEWKKDTSRLDILQEVAKIYYFEQDYDSAYFYYEKLVNDREMYGLDIYANEDVTIGYVYEKVGMDEKADEFFSAYAQYCETDESIYQSLNKALLYAHTGEIQLGIEQLKQFALQNNYQYWVVLYLDDDPLIEPLKIHPEYEEVIQTIEDRFMNNKAKLKNELLEKGFSDYILN